MGRVDELLKLSDVEECWPNMWEEGDCAEWKQIIQKKIREIEKPEDLITLRLGEEDSICVPLDLQLGFIEQMRALIDDDQTEINLAALHLPQADGKTLYGPIYFLVANTLSIKRFA